MPARKPRRRGEKEGLSIPDKANKVLNIIFIGLLLIVVRIWHLSVLQHEEKLEESRRPQMRLVISPAKRGTIRDRFNIPLALNKVQYQATILYSQIRQIPAWTFAKDEKGKRIRIPKRRRYIKELSQLLAKELEMEAERIEDLIHAKAALYNRLPLVIKEDVSEREFYRLRMLEKDWLGVQARCFPKRHYPMGPVAANIVGYMGAINKEEYEAIIGEIKELEGCLKELEEGLAPELPERFASTGEVKERLDYLKDRAYSLNDYIGKSGIEGKFEEALRGAFGKRRYYSDARGNFLREHPGAKEPQAGQRLLLTLSSELQAFTEELLIKSDAFRKARISGKGRTPKEPWIKGGAIVAIDPNNGELLAMASYPRFDPNDFVASGSPKENRRKQEKVRRWFETESFVAAVWEGKEPLQREVFDPLRGITIEEKWLTWDAYLESVLSEGHPVVKTLRKQGRIEDAAAVQAAAEKLMQLTEQREPYALFNTLYPEKPHGRRAGAVALKRLKANLEKNRHAIKPLKQELDRYLREIPHNYDKVLYIDLCRLAVPGHLFSKELLREAGGQPLSDYRSATCAMSSVTHAAKKMAKKLYHEVTFNPWKEENQKSYLKEKRREEKEKKRYPRPYIDHLDQKEQQLFEAFWKRHRWQLLTAFLIGDWIEAHPDEKLNPYLQHFTLWHAELSQGAHANVGWRGAYDRLQEALSGLSLDAAIQYLQTLREFNELDRSLLGSYRLVRSYSRKPLEKHLASAFYPPYGYGFARSHAYRQAAPLGSIFKIVTAYEALVQQYGKNPERLNPLTMEDRFFRVEKSEYVGVASNGRPIPRYYKGGRLPRSLSQNLGILDITTAIERSSNPYFALLAGEVIEKPEDLAAAARAFSYGGKTGIALPAEIQGRVPEDLAENRTGLYSFAIGQHSFVVTPLQTAVMLSAIANGGRLFEPKIVHLAARAGEEAGVVKIPSVIKRELFLPNSVREILLEGMQRVVDRVRRAGLGSFQQLYSYDPKAVRELLSLKTLVGKTSTAEAVENIDLDLEHGTNTYNHLWFGGIAFEEEGKAHLFKDRFGRPELIVVVFLRYGAYGKDTAPIAAQVIQKWREIKASVRPAAE